MPVLIVKGESIGEGGSLAPPCVALMRAFDEVVGSLKGATAIIGSLEVLPFLSAASARTAWSILSESCRNRWTASVDEGSRTLDAGRGRTGSSPLMLGGPLVPLDLNMVGSGGA